MANLLIEIGNTALKAAWADGVTLGKIVRYQGEKKTEFILSLIEKDKPEIMVIASVYDVPALEIKRIKRIFERTVILDPSHSGLLGEFGLPDYLTFDRAAALIGAKHMFSGKPFTLFDFGNTLTIDFIDADGVYQGGNVSLGCRTRFKALNRYSRALPLVNVPEKEPVLGTSVQSSLEAGVISGIVFEINGYIASKPDNVVIFTGGDANYFAKRMKNSIFVICNIVLMGLAIITDEYISKKIR